MRKATAISAVLLLLPMFLRAPEEHLHSAEHNNDHGGFFHSHASHFDEPEGTHLEENDSDHDAISVSWFAPVSQSVFSFVALLTTIEVLPIEVSEEPVSEKIEFRTHDPPLVHSSIPRSPPAFPFLSA